MQQLLATYDIPSRSIDVGIGVYGGQGRAVALQVRSPDRWTALLLLSSPDEGI